MKQFPFISLKTQQIFSIKLLCLIYAIGFVSSCSTDDLNPPEIGSQQSEGYMKIKFDLPSFHLPTENSGTNTRAMEKSDEIGLDVARLNVLVFKSDGTFYYQAPVVGTIQITQDTHIPSKATGEVTVKLVKSDTDTDKFNIIVLPNCDISSLTLTEGVTTKENVLGNLSFNTSDGKWKTTSTDKSHYFPMWGEVKDLVVTEKSMPNPKINLYRALARIDVGLAFELDEQPGMAGQGTENALGLEGYKLEGIQIYRTYEKGYVAPQGTAIPGEDSYLPSTIGARRTDDKPLEYPINFADTNKFVREIYLPEANLPQDAANDNMHCMVVKISGRYFRLDFAQDETKEKRVFLPILRNHRYIFNILKIRGEGFSTAEEALKSTASGSIDYDLVVWDESIHEMHIQGKYYLGLDNKEIILTAKSTADEATNFKNIKYQTNYPMSSADGITFEWENGNKDPKGNTMFKAEWTEQGQKGTIKITALTTNETNTVLDDVLLVKMSSFTIRVVVKQEYINFKYSLDCETVKVFGTYRPGYDLDGEKHQIKLSFTAEDISINGSPYEIYTEPINGITFKGKGIFNVTTSNLKTDIVLKGEGKLETPVDARTTPFTVKIVSNSSSGSYCEATITPVIAKMTVLTIGTNLYDVAPSSKANIVLTTPANFGPNDNSIVKIEGFEIISTGTAVNTTAQALLTKSDGKLADFVVLGFAADINSSNNTLFKEYLNKGGVIVAFLENPDFSAGPLLRSVFPGCIVRWTEPAFGGGTVYPFPGNTAYEASYVDPGNKPWDVYFSELQNDPILFGPFGDIRDKQWGEDASNTTWVSGLPTDYLTVYSTPGNLYNGIHLHNDKVTGFRYQSDDINIVFFGDGGFLSGLSTGTTAYPFQIDTSTNYPKPAKEYGHGTSKYSVYNSHVFSNAMAWAVERSTELYSKRNP